MSRGLRFPVEVIPPKDITELKAGVIKMLRSMATLERLVRRDNPTGILPSSFSVKPKNRGLTPRHEWLLGG